LQEIVVAFGNLHPGWKWIHSECHAPLGEWSHLTVTYSESSCETQIFVNGVLRKTAEVRGPLSACENVLQIGVKSFKKAGPTKTRYMGLIADVRLHDRALSAAEVQSKWAMPLKGDEANLVGWWPFDEGTGAVVGDRTSRSQHGELFGAVWHMSVTVPPSALADHMRLVLQHAFGADVTLVADGADAGVRCHRAILAARCEMFRAMFTGGMRESSQDTVVLSDIQPRALRLLVEYLYTDTVHITPDSAVELFVVANRYCLERLQRMCECVVLNSLSTENACQILEVADALQATQLRGIAFRWIIHNFGAVLQSPGFLDLDRALQAEINKTAAQMHFGSSAAAKKSQSLTSSSGATKQQWMPHVDADN
jgi:hypothetical protein